MKLLDLSIITPDIISILGLNKQSTNNLLSNYQRKGYITRIKRGYYINNKIEINIQEISNMFFADSYISLDTILFEKGIIKQYSRGVYSISTKGKTENINLGDYRLYKYITRIKSDLGIEIDDNGIRKATLERAILDSIYFKFFSGNYPGENELYLFAINNEKMNKLLEIYPKRVQDYYLKLVNR